MKKLKCPKCGKEFSKGYNKKMKLVISAELQLAAHLFFHFMKSEMSLVE